MRKSPYKVSYDRTSGWRFYAGGREYRGFDTDLQAGAARKIVELALKDGKIPPIVSELKKMVPTYRDETRLQVKISPQKAVKTAPMSCENELRAYLK